MLTIWLKVQFFKQVLVIKDDEHCREMASSMEAQSGAFWEDPWEGDIYVLMDK
jgi:hypothetical protein